MISVGGSVVVDRRPGRQHVLLGGRRSKRRRGLHIRPLCSHAGGRWLDPSLGASGAIAAVLGAYFVLYPSSTVRGLVVIFPV